MSKFDANSKGSLPGKSQSFKWREEEVERVKRKESNTEVPGSTLAFRKKPDVIAMLQQIDSDRAEAKSMMQESEPMSGRPHRLSPTMLILKERVATLNTFSGFTAVSVKFAVAELIRETLEIKDDDDDDPAWLPSEEWCYWFLAS